MPHPRLLRRLGVALLLSSMALTGPAPARAANRPPSRVHRRSPVQRHSRVTVGRNGKTARTGTAPATPGRRAEETEKAALEIPGLKTEANTALVTQALLDVRGVRSAIIDLRTCLAVVDYDPAQTVPAKFLAACDGAGFPANEYHVEDRFPKPIKLKGG